MKTLKYVDGNLLLNKDVEIIGHQANCQNTFGSGIARSIREMYPEAYAADTQANKIGFNKLGMLSVGIINPMKHGTKIKLICNLYGQNLYGKGVRQTNYEALFSALQGMRSAIDKVGKTPTVGFPYLIGCGLGGGDWNIVSRLIEVAFDGYAGEVLIVKFVP